MIEVGEREDRLAVAVCVRLALAPCPQPLNVFLHLGLLRCELIVRRLERRRVDSGLETFRHARATSICEPRYLLLDRLLLLARRAVARRRGDQVEETLPIAEQSAHARPHERLDHLGPDRAPLTASDALRAAVLRRAAMRPSDTVCAVGVVDAPRERVATSGVPPASARRSERRPDRVGVGEIATIGCAKEEVSHCLRSPRASGLLAPARVIRAGEATLGVEGAGNVAARPHLRPQDQVSGPADRLHLRLVGDEDRAASARVGDRATAEGRMTADPSPGLLARLLAARRALLDLAALVGRDEDADARVEVGLSRLRVHAVERDDTKA
ncbi:MAG TPA: hypothetical protein VJ838_07320, partial [Gaiellaceae bacterium]|nr:hypothetical protein [Gaiellaceae bacterium]